MNEARRVTITEEHNWSYVISLPIKKFNSRDEHDSQSINGQKVHYPSSRLLSDQRVMIPVKLAICQQSCLRSVVLRNDER